MNYKERFDDLRKSMIKKEINYIIILPGHNFRYMTGLKYNPLERLSFILLGSEPGDSYFFLPKVECAQVETLSNLDLDFDVFMWKDEIGPSEELTKLRRVFTSKEVKIGAEFNYFTLERKSQLNKLIQNAVLEDVTQIFYKLRSNKSEEEIKQFNLASEISDQALKNVIGQLELDIMEREISNQLKIELLKLGSEALPVDFKPIVATASNSANPHAKTGDNLIKQGQTLLIDTGACWEGYAIDITRTFLIEPIDSETKNIYQTVYKANKKAIESVHPGVKAEHVDQVARKIIDDSGYGEYFTHRTGHGIGLEEHEPPWIVSGNKSPLEQGMAFTIEPGIYIPELGGIRIEDNVVVTEDSYQLLTKYPKDLDSMLINL